MKPGGIDTQPCSFEQIRFMDAEQQARIARASENAKAEEAKGDEPMQATGNGDDPQGDVPPAETKVIAENNESLLRGEDTRPPRIGEGSSRLGGGAATGAGSAAEGIGEGVGKAASGVGAAVKGVGHAVERLASAGEDAGPLRSATTHKNPYTVDAGASWGRSGQLETSRERGSEQIPESARQSMGIDPGMTSEGVSPVPEILPGPAGSRFEPDTDHSAGTWNASDIFANTRIRG